MQPSTQTELSALSSKVPQVTLFFWIIKILATTVGETAADLLSVRLDLGLVTTSLVMSAVFIVVLIWQVRAKTYIPPLYWITVVLISIVGTLISDYLVDGLEIDLITTSLAFGSILALVFTLWYRSERTLSIHTIVTRRRELFYWATILFTFALGTSAGDLMAESIDLGYGPSALLFAGLIAVVALSFYGLRASAVLCFWIAYILTRPLGASLGDYLAKPVIADGLGLGTVFTSFVFLGFILILVSYLTVGRSDRMEDRASEA
jgi:uncharacterized membrane-anchored protein